MTSTAKKLKTVNSDPLVATHREAIAAAKAAAQWVETLLRENADDRERLAEVSAPLSRQALILELAKATAEERPGIEKKLDDVENLEQERQRQHDRLTEAIAVRSDELQAARRDAEHHAGVLAEERRRYWRTILDNEENRLLGTLMSAYRRLASLRALAGAVGPGHGSRGELISYHWHGVNDPRKLNQERFAMQSELEEIENAERN